jgi:hypothetical protein
LVDPRRDDAMMVEVEWRRVWRVRESTGFRGPNTNKCHANVPLANKYLSDTNTNERVMLSRNRVHDLPCAAVAAMLLTVSCPDTNTTTLLALTTRSTRQDKTRQVPRRYAIISTRNPSIEFFLPATPSANCRETHSAFGNGRLAAPPLLIARATPPCLTPFFAAGRRVVHPSNAHTTFVHAMIMPFCV